MSCQEGTRKVRTFDGEHEGTSRSSPLGTGSHTRLGQMCLQLHIFDSSADRMKNGYVGEGSFLWNKQGADRSSQTFVCCTMSPLSNLALIIGQTTRGCSAISSRRRENGSLSDATHTNTPRRYEQHGSMLIYCEFTLYGSRH